VCLRFGVFMLLEQTVMDPSAPHESSVAAVGADEARMRAQHEKLPGGDTAKSIRPPRPAPRAGRGPRH
jgi:hypothetical protein